MVPVARDFNLEIPAEAVFASGIVEERNFEATVEVPAGKTMAILGPNGAGKSTLLSIISGTLVPDEGLVKLGDRTITDTTKRVQVPVHKRDVGILAQAALLFPHLSVESNVQFGPRSKGFGSASTKMAKHWMKRVGVEQFAKRKPHQLSGGQAQRVAVARALAAEPRVMLLDEPMAALDINVSGKMRQVFTEVFKERTTLLVTHDLLDVLAMADLVTVIEDGKVSETGTVTEVLNAPRSDFGARLAGVNLVRGTVTESQALVGDGITVWGTNLNAPSSKDGVALFSPASVSIFRKEAEGSPRNMWPVKILSMSAMQNSVRVRARIGGVTLFSDITPASANSLGLTEGDEVFFSVKAQEIEIHPTKN